MQALGISFNVIDRGRNQYQLVCGEEALYLGILGEKRKDILAKRE